MQLPSLVELLQAGVHFGHKKSRWHPKMKPFIYTERNGVHIIDLEKTQQSLEKMHEAVANMVADGKVILFTTTKPHAREIVREAAIACEMPYLVDRWIGGMLTNFDEIKKLIKKYLDLQELKQSGEIERYTKKEQVLMEKDLVKMHQTLAGLVTLHKMPDVIFTPTMQREKTAITEANKMHVPIIAVCDTNANPIKAQVIVPGNDDAINSLKVLVAAVRDAVLEGRERAKKNEMAREKTEGEKFGATAAPKAKA